MNHRRRTFSTARRGYVLLVTLALLVLSSTLLVAIGRAAAHHALQAQLEQSELQRRWGTISCREATLPYAEQILVLTEQQEAHAAPEVRATVQLGPDHFTLVIADEQAKANVNLVIDQAGEQAAEDRIRQALSGGGLGNDFRLRPAILFDDSSAPATQPAIAQLIRGPGQMFDSVTPDQLINARPGITAPMQMLTCWGNGSLNILRANRDAMRCALGHTLSELEISRLLAVQAGIMKPTNASHDSTAAKPAANTDAIGTLLARAQIDPGKRNRLSIAVCSSCHSVWIIEQDPKRQWNSLWISDTSNPNRVVSSSIVW